jgi:predicted RNA-binding Zn-ribbon protein involved in translation (DUF1610 family)
MFDKLLRLEGSIEATMSGLLGISADHKRYLVAGYKCPSCGESLSRKTDFYLRSGRKVPRWVNAKAISLPKMIVMAGCPKCGYRWEVYEKSQPAVGLQLSVIDVVETDRSEEYIGDDQRLIDNSRSSTKVTRKFALTKEWSRTYSIEYEKSHTDRGELNIAIPDIGGLKASAEHGLRQKYSMTDEAKETYHEEIETEVPAFTKLSLVFRWKRIWQHGLIHLGTPEGDEIMMPYKIVVGITFDQLQADEKS